MMGGVKGIILNLLERVVSDRDGEDVWDDVLDDAGSDGAFTALGNYDDAEVLRLIQALARHRGTDAATVLRDFGRAAMPLLHQRYPDFFSPADPVGFVTSLDEVIHVEVVKLYEGASPPRLTFSDVGDGAVTIRYRSQRALSDLAIGFLHGAADHWSTTLDVERTIHDDAGTDVTLRCRFSPAAGEVAT